jgi:lysophospholipase L1-like esterase
LRFWTLTTIILIFFLELSLQTVSFVGNLYQRRLNTIDKESTFRVLTLGESTTADIPLVRGLAWPRIAETLMKKRGRELQVINLAQVGTNTTALVEILPKAIDEHKPHLVITMMGINDNPYFGLRRNYLVPIRTSWLHKIKTLKLIITLLDYYRYDPGIQEKTDPYRHSGQAYEFARRLKQGEDVEQEIQNKSAQLTPIEQAHFYTRLATILSPDHPETPNKDFIHTQEFYKRSLEITLSLEVNAREFLWLSRKLDRIDDCLWLLNRYIDEDVKISATNLARMTECLSPNSYALQKYFEQLEDYELHQLNTEDLTKKNYQLLVEFLMQQNICLISMQYPLLSRRLLSEYFDPALLSRLEGRKIWIVDNEQNFRQALKDYTYDELFIDRFAGEFGHTTVLGSQLIAEKITPVIEKVLSSGECQ